MELEDLIAKVTETETEVIVNQYQTTNRYGKTYLAKCFLTMSNDSFYRAFGFNWIPNEYWKNKAIKAYGLR